MVIISQGAAGPGGGPRSAKQVGNGCVVECQWDLSPRLWQVPGTTRRSSRALFFRHAGLAETNEICGFVKGTH
jgi:hypothetical protein